MDGIGKDIVNSTNFLFFSFYIKAMKGLFESFKKRKYIDQMYMAENKENQKYYFIIGKYYERRLQWSLWHLYTLLFEPFRYS